METITIQGIDPKLLDKQRLLAWGLVSEFRAQNVRNEKVDALIGILHLLDDWSDERFFEESERFSLIRDSLTGKHKLGKDQ